MNSLIKAQFLSTQVKIINKLVEILNYVLPSPCDWIIAHNCAFIVKKDQEV